MTIIIIVISWLLPRLHARLMPDRVRGGAATTGAWAGSGLTGASAGPCALAVAFPGRSARQTSACRRASSGGRRRCCSRFPLYAPWTCSLGCTSPAIRSRSTQGLTWGGNVELPGCRAKTSPSRKCGAAIKYLPGVCTWLWQFYELSWASKADAVQHTTKKHTRMSQK